MRLWYRSYPLAAVRKTCTAPLPKLVHLRPVDGHMLTSEAGRRSVLLPRRLLRAAPRRCRCFLQRQRLVCSNVLLPEIAARQEQARNFDDRTGCALRGGCALRTSDVRGVPRHHLQTGVWLALTAL